MKQFTIRQTVSTASAAVLLAGLTLHLFAQNPEAVPVAGPNTNDISVIDLPTVLQLAGARSLDIQIAREKLAEARANRESSVWQFFPSITPGVGYRRHDNLIQDVQGNIVDVHKDSYTVGPVIGGQLDIGDAVYKNLASRQLVKAAEWGLESQRQDSILAAVLGYFDLAKAQSAVSVAQEAVKISHDYAGQVQRAVDAGVAFKGDALRAQVQSERNQLTLRQTQEQQRAGAARLVQTLHMESGVELVAWDDELLPLDIVSTNASLDSLVAQAVSTRPELAQNRFLVGAAKDAKNGAKFGPLIPSLGAQIFVGGLGGGNETAHRGLGESEDYAFTLGWRFGPGGLFDRGRIRAADARLKIADLNSRKLLDDITRQVTEGFSRWQSLSDQIAAARRAVQAAEETLRLTAQRKEFAVGAVLENIQSEQELTRTRLDYLNAIAEYNKAQYALRKAIGTIPASTSATNEAPLKPRATNSKPTMNTLNAIFVITSLITSSGCAASLNFDDVKAGEAPAGWSCTKTGSGNPTWVVVADDTAPSKPNVLKQSGQATYPVALKDDMSLKDGFVEVKLKPVSGKDDQAGGVIWRAKDADNYYIARANALEDNVTIYHTINGKRVSFKNVNTPVKSGIWHTLRVDFAGNNFTVTFDSHKVIEASDDNFGEAGKVGVWTKADSVTLFDDFSYGSK
jgi:outer membrane protein TolC